VFYTRGPTSDNFAVVFDLFNDDLDRLAAVGHAVEAIEDIAKWGAANEKQGGDALHTIATIADTLRGMFERKITAQDTEEEIATLRHTLIGVDDRFDRSEG